MIVPKGVTIVMGREIFEAGAILPDYVAVVVAKSPKPEPKRVEKPRDEKKEDKPE